MAAAPPSKSKKRKSPPAADDGSGPRTRHKKPQAEIELPAQNAEFEPTNHLAPPRADAPSMIPPSGQVPVEDPPTENHPAQEESQSLRLDVPQTWIIDEPETMDMDQGFEFESPGKYLVEASQPPMGVWTSNPTIKVPTSAAELPTGRPKRVNFDVSKGKTKEVVCIPHGNTGSAMVEPEVIIPQSSSPLFVNQRSAATPLRHKQGRQSLTTPRGSSEIELSTSNTTADTSRISETPPKMVGHCNPPNRPPSPKKIAKRQPKFSLPKKNTPLSSSETFVEGTCTQPEGFSGPNPFGPEDQWRNATREESLPAILHSFVTVSLIHVVDMWRPLC